MLGPSTAIIITAHATHLGVVRATPAHLKSAATLTDQVNQAFYDWAEGVWADPKQRTSDHARLINDVKEELEMLGHKITR